MFVCLFVSDSIIIIIDLQYISCCVLVDGVVIRVAVYNFRVNPLLISNDVSFFLFNSSMFQVVS